VAGLSGLGDLLLTCTSAHSRNFSFGFALGGGALPTDILAACDGVVEGVATAPALVARALRAGASVPVCAAVAAVVGGRITLEQAVTALLARPLRDE
jgi:glycerol-3-phosphate dehydrogenase (NAD(P)+)